MFSLRKPVSTKVAPTVTLLITAPHHGALVADLQSRMPHIDFAMAPALESQQQDADDQQAAIDEVEKTIDEYDEAHPHTGPLHVYMLDGKASAGMDDQSESALRGLMHSAINSPTRTVAALMPEDSTVTKKEDLSMSTMLRQLADSVLSTEGVTLLVGQEALESFLKEPEIYMQVATEGLIGNAAKAFRRAFSSKAPHPDGLPKSVNMDVSSVVEGRFKKTYLNPSWVRIQKLKQGEISGSGILVDLQVAGQMPSDPLHAVREGAVAIEKYVTTHIVAYQHYLQQFDALVAADATATEATAKADSAKAVEALKSPFNLDDTQILSKVPGSPAIKVTDDDVQLHRNEDAAHRKPITALTADQVTQYAQVALEEMKRAYALSLKLTTTLGNLFNKVIDLSHNADTMAKLSPAVAARVREVAKGKGIFLLFDYTAALLLQAGALERWCYRTVGGKDRYTASSESLTDIPTGGFKQATDGQLDTATTESFVGVAVIGGLIAAIAGWNKLSANKRKREEDARAAAHPLGEGVHTLNEDAFENMAKQFEKTFFDPKWCSAHPLRAGTVSAGGIAEYLMDGQQIATNPAQSVQKDYAKVTTILRGTKALVTPYLKDLEKLSTEALHQLAEGERLEDYTRVGKYLEAQMPTIRRPEQRGTIPEAELLGNLKYVPGDWHTVGKFIRTVKPTIPQDIPAMTQPVFDEAVKFLKTIFGNGGANLFQLVSTVYHLTPEFSRAHYTELMDSVDNVTIWRFFGDEYGYEHYGDHGANVGPKVYQGYLYLCLEHLVTEVEALVTWMERSVA